MRREAGWGVLLLLPPRHKIHCCDAAERRTGKAQCNAVGLSSDPHFCASSYLRIALRPDQFHAPLLVLCSWLTCQANRLCSVHSTPKLNDDARLECQPITTVPHDTVPFTTSSIRAAETLYHCRSPLAVSSRDSIYTSSPAATSKCSSIRHVLPTSVTAPATDAHADNKSKTRQRAQRRGTSTTSCR